MENNHLILTPDQVGRILCWAGSHQVHNKFVAADLAVLEELKRSQMIDEHANQRRKSNCDEAQRLIDKITDRIQPTIYNNDRILTPAYGKINRAPIRTASGRSF